MRCFRIAALAGVAALLAGCAAVSPYERPVVQAAITYPVEASASGASYASNLPWRKFIVDERLRRLIEIALANNLDLRAAVLRVEQSRAQYGISHSERFPTINGDGSYTRSHAEGQTLGSWSASLGATAYELDLFGRVRSLDRQAMEKYFATVQAQRNAQIALIAEICSQYIGLRQAETQTELAEETLATVRQSHDLNRVKFDAGATDELDVRTAEGQVKTAEIQLLTYQRQVAQANNSLALLLGQALPGDLPAHESFIEGDPFSPVAANLPSELVQWRPDILEAEHMLKAAHANLDAARAAFFPSISLTGSLGTTSADFDGLFGSGTGIWSFLPKVTIPLFTGRRNRANFDVAEIGERIEVTNYQKAIQTAFREVADALAANESHKREYDARAGLVAALRARFDLANTRFLQGEDGYQSVLSAQQDLYSAEQGLLLARHQLLYSRISVYRALGGGW